MNEEAAPVKRRAGRPSNAEKAASAKASAVKEMPKYKMKAKPNWDDIIPGAEEDNPDRLHISRDLIPDGMDAQWVTDSVFGQPQPQRRSSFERRGWTPVHQEDFDRRFDGMWMPKGVEGEIKVDGLVLMMRPMEFTRKARLLERRNAMERVQIKEAALKGGVMPNVSLDAGHPTAVNSNRINKSYERIEIPKD